MDLVDESFNNQLKSTTSKMQPGHTDLDLATDNTYEEIVDLEDTRTVFPPAKRSNSDTDLLRLLQDCSQEVEVINSLIKRPKGQQQDVTFSLYGHTEPEQGFYKCHDSIYDVPEGQRIPDLLRKRPKVQNSHQKRLSLDSGHGTSVADSESLNNSYESRIKANFEDLNTSEALEKICGSSSLESLPGFKLKCASPPPPPLPPRRRSEAPPPALPPSSKKKSLSREIPKGQQQQQQNLEGKKRKQQPFKTKNPLRRSCKLTPVKLLKAASPFCRKKGVASNKTTTPQVTSAALEANKENNQRLLSNLESLIEARTYNLPLIPFPYSSAEKVTPTVRATPLYKNAVLAAAATEPRNFHFKSPLATPTIAKRLNFEDEPEEVIEATPMSVRALATPAGRRRHFPPSSATEPRPPRKHCGSCTCNQALSRREMLTRINFDNSATSLKLNNNFASSSEDYVKMSSAKVIV